MFLPSLPVRAHALGLERGLGKYTVVAIFGRVETVLQHVVALSLRDDAIVQVPEVLRDLLGERNARESGESQDNGAASHRGC